jgi:exoribonuclease R
MISIEAFVRLEENSPLGRDIFIPNPTLRNRAIHGDIVAVELLDRKFWRISNILSPQFPEEEDSEQSYGPLTLHSLFRFCLFKLAFLKTKIFKFILFCNTDNTMTQSSTAATTTANDLRPCGKIVGIFKRNWRPYVCTLQLEKITKSG